MNLAVSLHSHDIRSDLLLSRDIRAEWEWMSVFLASRLHSGDSIHSTLCIHSSFGSFGMSWRDRLEQEPGELRLRLRRQVLTSLLNMAREDFIRGIVGEDEDIPDFEASQAYLLDALENALEAEDPQSAGAQALREIFLTVTEAIESIPDDFSEAHRAELLQGIPELWDVVPDEVASLPKCKPSRRRQQATGFYDRLWSLFLETLSLEEEAGA